MSTERQHRTDEGERLAPGELLEGAAPQPPPPSASELDALFAHVEGAVTAERGPRAWLRSQATPLRWAAAALVVIAIVVSQLVFKPRVDLAIYPVLRMVLSLAAMGAFTLVALGVGLQPLQRPPAPRWLAAVLLLVGALAPLALALLPAAHAHLEASLVGAGRDLVPRALACFGYGGVLGLPVLLLTLLLDRGGHVSLRRAVAAGLAAGLAGNLALQVHCAIVHPIHLVLGHASLALVYPLLYAGLSRLVTARTSSVTGPWPTP